MTTCHFHNIIVHYYMAIIYMDVCHGMQSIFIVSGCYLYGYVSWDAVWLYGIWLLSVRICVNLADCYVTVACVIYESIWLLVMCLLSVSYMSQSGCLLCACCLCHI